MIHGFLYNITDGTFSDINAPFAGGGGNQGTFALGISGSDIVGGYRDSTGRAHGFLYDGFNYVTLDAPLANTIPDQGSSASGIFGDYIVETYYDSNSKPHGYLYDGSTYTSIDAPLGANGTFASGISGSNIVGTYYDSTGIAHGYVAEIVPEPVPEPATGALLLLGCAFCICRRTLRTNEPCAERQRLQRR